MMCFAIFDLVRNDEVLTDDLMNRYTLDQKHQADSQTNYEYLSDRMDMKFPGYEMDDRCFIVPKKDTPTVKFSWLKDLLLSKDLSREKELDWIDSEGYRFLDKSEDMLGNMVAFQSFPRTGNTFLRRYLENITGVFTGADMSIKWTTAEAMMGQLGQN